MKFNPTWIHAHRRVVILALAACVFVTIFFIAPVIPDNTSLCVTDWESLGYHFYKTGYHVFTGLIGCLQ